MQFRSTADLHVHSKYSDRPAEWFLRRVGAPECFVEPLDVYHRAKDRGMNFVTIADHNSICGALEIAHLPGTFLSNEVTTYFPEDGCKIHVLVCGIDEAQFRAIQEVRASIYDLHRYLLKERIFCSVNHPLYRVNDRLTIEHFEKLLLMFKRFELVNGSRLSRGTVLLKAILGNLTPDMIDEMANRHGLDPTGPESWRKWTTGGSDDHSGVHPGTAYTVTPFAANTDEFLAHLQQGRHEADGVSGGSLLLAHDLYYIAYNYYKERFLGPGNGQSSVIGQVLEQLVGQPDAPPGMLSRFVPGFAKRFLQARRMRQLSDLERLMIDEVSSLLTTEAPRDCSGSRLDSRRAFVRNSRIAHAVGYSLIRKFESQLREGRVIDAIQSVASLGAVTLAIAPYLAAFSTQHKNEAFLRAVAEHFPATRRLAQPGGGKAWFTDTFTDVNGVSRTVQSMAAAAKKAGKPLTVLTGLDEVPTTSLEVKNFTPVGTFELPEYASQRLCFPPFLEIIEYVEDRHFDEVILSTPGPLGLAGLAAARLLGVRKTGIYHTDLPLLVRHLTLDHGMEELTRKYVHWFYSQMDRVLVPSEYYRNHLVEMGFDTARLTVMGHGVDCGMFRPGRANPKLWSRYGLKSGFTFIYVGRISPDKNTVQLLEAFGKLLGSLPAVNLAVVGDGPQLSELRTRFHHPRIGFTGFLQGDALAEAYASADAMVFPSRADTFGLAVLEALASGLPAIVSDQGGPSEIIARHGAGIIVDLEKPEALVGAMRALVEQPELYGRCRAAALRTAQESTWASVLERMWNDREVDHRADTVVSFRHAVAGATGGLIAMDVA